MSIELILSFVKVLIVFMMILQLVPLLIWMERKGAAYIQDRRGPNRAALFGIFRLGGIIHSLSDAVKLMVKADFNGAYVYKPLFIIAPMIALFVATSTAAVIPFAEPLILGKLAFNLQVADLNAGLIYVFAMSSLSVYTLLLSGWASNSKYSLLGMARAAAQLVSYEIAMGLSVVTLFLVAGSFRLNDIVADQGAPLFHWNAFRLPLSFIIFFTALFAEANRLPFDLPEGEAELTAGYHTEYSSMRFALFFLGEYAHMIVGSLIVTMLFFGGWHIPFVSSEFLRANTMQVIHLLWLVGIGGALTLGAALLLWWKKRRHFWGDKRDWELLIFAVLFGVVGAALALTYTLFSDAIFPVWAQNLFIFLLQMKVVLIKTLFFVSVFIWVRWTLPRFRYDQLMNLGWKVMIPLGLLNVLITGICLLMK